VLDVRDIQRAAARIAPYVIRTPFQLSAHLSELIGGKVFLKSEHLQPTGSFKVRGAANKLLSLHRPALDQGVIAASTGNHGAAVARAARFLGGRATIFVPETISAAKLDKMKELGATICPTGSDGVEAEFAAREYASAHGLAYISPYNDVDVIAGQGTVGLEIRDDLTALEAIYLSVGGGGLAAGVASYVKSVRPEVAVVACSPERSAVMHHSVAAGRILELDSLDTLSDGTAGGIEPDTITFNLCRELIDRWILVPEDSIASALRMAVTQLHLRIEGSAAVAIAGLTIDAARRPIGSAAAVLCGGNIDQSVLERVLLEQ
jgi:threonine dehydratase